MDGKDYDKKLRSFMQGNFVLELNWMAEHYSYILLDKKHITKLFWKIN